MVYQKDIAAICGVSEATVSKALHGHSDIGQKTQQRIREVAAKIGYRKTDEIPEIQDSREIGVLYGDFESGKDNEADRTFYAEIFHSFKKTVEQQGYSIRFLQSAACRGEVSYLAAARLAGVRGICMAGVDYEETGIRALLRGEIPLVLIEHVENEKNSILTDSAEDTRELLHYIAEQGHHRIACVYSLRNRAQRNAYAAFRECMMEMGMEVPGELCLDVSGKNRTVIEGAIRKMVHAKYPPTCIFFTEDILAYMGWNALLAGGMQIPEDVSIAGYGGMYPLCLPIDLATVVRNTEEIGRKAGENIIRQAEYPCAVPPRIHMIKGDLHRGTTVLPCRSPENTCG